MKQFAFVLKTRNHTMSTFCKKYATALCCCFILLSLLANSSVSFGSGIDDDDNNEAEKTIDLREILKVQELIAPVLSGEVNIDGVLDESFWKEAGHYEIELETYPAQHHLHRS